MSQTWKGFERRVCAVLGTRRRGQVERGGWARGSDDDGSFPFSLQIKYTARYSLRRSWIKQARKDANEDGRPFALIQGEHRQPTNGALVTVELTTFAMLLRAAGLVDAASPLADTHDSTPPATEDPPSQSNVTYLR